jgi:hypothetical protein
MWYSNHSLFILKPVRKQKNVTRHVESKNPLAISGFGQEVNFCGLDGTRTGRCLCFKYNEL